jgi:hypothetical protein
MTAMRKLVLVLVFATLMTFAMPSVCAWGEGKTVTASPSSVRPGQNLTIRGSGFNPGNSVVIRWCFGGPLPEYPIVDDAGSFQVIVQVPRNAPAGQTCIEGSGFGQVAFTILASGSGQSVVSPSERDVKIRQLAARLSRLMQPLLSADPRALSLQDAKVIASCLGLSVALVTRPEARKIFSKEIFNSACGAVLEAGRRHGHTKEVNAINAFVDVIDKLPK